MRRLLLCAGIHGKPRCLNWLQKTVEQREPDALIFAGGVLDLARQYAPRTTSWGMTRADALFVEKFFAALGKLGVFSVVIPGPMDAPLEDFLRIGMHAEIEYPNVHLAHATLIEKQDVAFCGVGGCITAGPAAEIDLCSRTMAEYALRPLRLARQPRKVLLFGAPPTGALGGAEGSSLMSEWIDSYHPSLCVVGGDSEHRGSQRVAHTLIVNPGYLADGWAAWLDWKRSDKDQLELLNVRETNQAVEIGVAD